MRSQPSPATARPSVLGSRTALLACFVGVTFVVLFLLARESWAIVLYRVLTDGLLMSAWLLACAGWGTLSLRGWFSLRSPDADDTPAPLLGAITAVAMGLGAVSLLVLGLGLAGWLNHITAIAILIVGIVCLAVRFFALGFARMQLAANAWLATPARWDWLWLAVAPMLGAAVVGAMAPPGILWKADEPHPYDVTEYHLQVPREWFEAGKIIPLHHNVFSFFPFNVESHYLLAMHLYRDPWAAAYACQLMHLAMVAMSALAVFALLSRTSDPGATIAGILVATTPWLAQLGCIAYDEGGLLLFGTLAIGWMSRAITGASVKPSAALVAGIFAGFACGSKLTAVPEVLAAVPLVATLILLLSRRQIARTRKAALIAMVLFVVGGVGAFCPWLVRNVSWAHNPIFPEGASLLGSGPFTPEQVERWNVAHAPPPAQRSIAARLEAGLHQIVASWQFGYVLLPVGVLCIAFTFFERSTQLYFGVFVVLCATWLFATHLQGRFFVLAIPLCGMLLGQMHWRKAVPFIAGLAVLVSVFNTMAVISELDRYLVGGGHSVIGFGLAQERMLGVDQFTPNEALLTDLPSDATLVLAGDAQAFWYPIPMSRLRYRTVFDVVARPGEDEVRAWIGSEPLPPNARIRVDPLELLRLYKTYRNIPAPSREIIEQTPRDSARRPMSFFVDPKLLGR